MKYEEYKDSGVEWIGEVPSHWEVMRFKDFTSLQTTASDNMNKIGLKTSREKQDVLLRVIQSLKEMVLPSISEMLFIGNYVHIFKKFGLQHFQVMLLEMFSCSVPKIIVIINICFIACYQMVSRLCVMVQLLGQKCLGYLPIS